MTLTDSRRLTYLSLASLATLVSLAAGVRAEAPIIGKPPDARSWILVYGGDCDDDGPNANVDRGHCVGVVNNLTQSGDLGHGQYGGNFSLFANASLNAESFHGTRRADHIELGEEQVLPVRSIVAGRLETLRTSRESPDADPQALLAEHAITGLHAKRLVERSHVDYRSVHAQEAG